MIGTLIWTGNAALLAFLLLFLATYKRKDCLLLVIARDLIAAVAGGCYALAIWGYLLGWFR